VLAQVFMTIGDGLFWRRAIDPGFDPAIALPATLGVLAGLLRPVAEPGQPQAQATTNTDGDMS